MKGYIYEEDPIFGDYFKKIIGFGDIGFLLREIPRKQANDIILENHYSHKFYNLSYIHLGVFINQALKGVLQFGYAMNPLSMGG